MRALDPKLPLIQRAPLDGKVVLIRFDHNVVKKGKIKDPYRIDRSLGTLYSIVDHGARPILMTHVGRPRDKKTGEISCRDEESVKPIAEYLERKLRTRFVVPDLAPDPKRGITGIGDALRQHIRDLKARKFGGIYLPNTRWFESEEGKGEGRESFARELAGLADVYVNDAFGSWQAHASTYDVAKHLPSYAGYLMQEEIANLDYVFNPDKPFTAVVAGSKYDTKIGPLYAIYKKADYLILGGVLYNAFLCAKYGVKIAGVADSDIDAAKELVAMDEQQKKLVELPYVVESDTLDGKIQGKYRTLWTKDFKQGQSYGYVLDIDPRSFDDPNARASIEKPRTIFVNAVMGLTPHFGEGSRALYELIHQNTSAMKLYGGGDTLQEFKNLCPGLYVSVIDDSRYYFFTGGGTVLTAIEQGSPYGLKPVQILMERGGKAV